MWVMLCDGCRSHGIDTDLTERQNQAATVSLTPAEVLHLCPEKCSPLYYEKRVEIRKLQSETMQSYHARVSILKQQLWEMFANAEKATDDPGEPARLPEQDHQGSPQGEKA